MGSKPKLTGGPGELLRLPTLSFYSIPERWYVRRIEYLGSPAHLMDTISPSTEAEYERETPDTGGTPPLQPHEEW